MSESKDQSGGCLCGAIRFAVEGARVVGAKHCHCLDCQRSTGSAFVTFCMVAEAGLALSSGQPASHAVTGTSGGEVERFFCRDCGSPLWSKVAVAPGLFFVKAGAFDDGSWIEPSEVYWASTAQPWAPPNPELPAHDANPG